MELKKRAGRRNRARLLCPILVCLVAVLATAPAVGGSADEPPCQKALADFAAERGLPFEASDVEYGERWAGAGHEIMRLPGYRAYLPAAHCQGSLAIDLSETCKLIKSRGEGGCRASYPPAFY